jgi:hypothetical protein
VVRILKRETPLGVVVNPAAPGPTALAEKLGIAVASLSEQPPSFARRARAHSALSFECDPVLSFQPRTLDWDMGDNSLSSFLVHNEGSGDGVAVTGEMSERWAVDVGLPPSTPLESLPEIELEVAAMPCFLSGVTSLFDGQALEVGWAVGEAPEIEQIGECIQVWTKVLFDMHAVDVRIVFATPRGRSPVLTAMRARARAFRASRDASISDRANVLAPVAIDPSLGGIVNG